MDLLLYFYPTLKYDTWVLIVDGDPAKFKAARIKFENVRIILRLYHATENVKCGRIGYTRPTGRTGPSPDPSDPTAYYTHTSLAQLLASSSLLVEVYPSF